MPYYAMQEEFLKKQVQELEAMLRCLDQYL